MKTLTLLKNAEKALIDLMNYTCEDFHTLEKDTDWGAIEMALDSVQKVRKSYEETTAKKNAKAVKIKP